MRQLMRIGEYLEEVEQDPEIREMFDAFAQEHSDWSDCDMPDSLTLRFVEALCLWSIANPKRYEAHVLRYKYEMTQEQVASQMGVSQPRVAELLRPVFFSEMENKIKFRNQ